MHNWLVTFPQNFYDEGTLLKLHTHTHTQGKINRTTI